MTARKDQRDHLNELLEGLLPGDGCAAFLAGLLCIVLLVVGIALLWSSCGC
jgi:hypothetical protein